jgi:hypothetical protein
MAIISDCAATLDAWFSTVNEYHDAPRNRRDPDDRRLL